MYTSFQSFTLWLALVSFLFSVISGISWLLQDSAEQIESPLLPLPLCVPWAVASSVFLKNVFVIIYKHLGKERYVSILPFLAGNSPSSFGCRDIHSPTFLPPGLTLDGSFFFTANSMLVFLFSLHSLPR